jgi:pimeloyl-ACP methyl ester carboxylesterase
VRVPSRLGRLKGVLGRAFLTAPGPLPPPSPISTRFFRHAILCRSASPAQVAFCQEIVRACRPDARVGCGRMLSELDLLDAVHRLTVPTSVVAGSLDRLTPPSHAERMARALPDLVERVVVDACGHMGPVEAPDAILGVIERLVARVRVPEPAA